MLALVTNPHVLAAAHRELDEVVGDNQSPGFSHRAKLPYIDAILRETLRWRPAVAINPPHTSIEDDVYEGYHIPKGTSIMANHW